MQFKISKSEFLKSLNLVAKAASTTTPMPSLCGIKIEATGDSITMIASDSNISIKSTLYVSEEENELSIIEEGVCVIDYRYIVEIVRKLDGKTITLEIMDGTLIKITGGTSEFKLNGIPVNDYPEINFSISQNKFKFKPSILNEIVEQTSFACSDKETRPALTGVNLIAKDKKLYVNATDSYRLASKIIDIDEDLNFNITIPSKHLSEVSRSIQNEKEIEIAIDNQKIAFIFDNNIMLTRLIEDSYPDTSRLIPSSFTQTLTLSSKDLVNAIDRTSFIKSDGKNVVKMAIDSEYLTVTSSSQEIGSSFEKIAIISYTGNPLTISCSGKYLTDAIKALKSETVVMKFNGDIKPIIIAKPDDENILQLISPVRTYN